MRNVVALLSLCITCIACTEKVYVNADGTPAQPPPQAQSSGPSGGEVALGVTAAILSGAATGMASGPRKEWVKANAASIATCLHGSASSDGKHEILSEDVSTMKARVYWSGVFGGEHYSDVLITFNGETATLAVAFDSGNFSPDGDCRYLQGVAWR